MTIDLPNLSVLATRSGVTSYRALFSFHHVCLFVLLLYISFSLTWGSNTTFVEHAQSTLANLNANKRTHRRNTWSPNCNIKVFDFEGFNLMYFQWDRDVNLYLNNQRWSDCLFKKIYQSHHQCYCCKGMFDF